MTTTTEHIFVDGDGDQRREVAGGEETIRRLEEAEKDTRRVKSFGEISKIQPVSIYIPTLSVRPSGTTRWHRDAES